MSQNTRTNYFLGTLNNIIQNPKDKDKSLSIEVTVVVAGQIITGKIASEEEYFNHELTSIWKDAYNLTIRDPRQKHLDLPDEEFNIDEFPDHLKQGFLLLTNAFYVIGDKTIPSIGNAGIPIQVRLADIVAFNFGSVSVGKS